MRTRFAIGGLGIKDVSAVASTGGGAYSPPIVDAGADTEFYSLTGTLAGSVTPGSDLNPTILWTVVDNGAGSVTFADDSSPTTNITRVSGNFITLKLTATPNDGPAVSDTTVVSFAL